MNNKFKKFYENLKYFKIKSLQLSNNQKSEFSMCVCLLSILQLQLFEILKYLLLFSALMDEPPAVLYATVQDNKVLPYGSYQLLSYDHVHLDTAGAFVGKTNYTIPSDGIYVVTLTSATHNDPVHASFINLKFKIMRYTTVKTPARSTNSYTFIMSFNKSEVISNKFYAENETHLSSETSIAVFKYFRIDGLCINLESLYLI